MSRNSLVILAWSIATALLVSACGDRPGAFKAIDLSKVQVKTQPDTQRNEQDKKSADEEKAAQDRAALEELARTARQIELDMEARRKQEATKSSEGPKGTSEDSESTLPSGQAEGKRVETSQEGTEFIRKLNAEVFDKGGLQIITALVRGMDFSVVKNANGTVKLTIEALVLASMKDDKAQKSIESQVAVISTTDADNFLKPGDILSSGKFVELDVPAEVQNSDNKMTGLKFFAGYESARRDIIIIYVTFEAASAGQAKEQFGVGMVKLKLQSLDAVASGQKAEIKTMVTSSSWGSRLLSVKEAQDLLAKEGMEKTKSENKQETQTEHVDNDAMNPSVSDPINDNVDETSSQDNSKSSQVDNDATNSSVSDPMYDAIENGR